MKYTTEKFEGLQELLKEIGSKTRDELEGKIIEFAYINRLAKEIGSTLKLDECLRILTDRIADLLSVERISLMLLDRETEELVIKMAKGLDDSVAEEVRLKPGEGIAGWIAKEGRPLLIADIEKDSRFAKRDGKYNTASLLSVPLKIEDRVIGVVNVNNKISKDIFKETDLNALVAISELASIAIENARLHEQLKICDDMKSNFISNVSHELRSPLSSIKESISLLLDEINGVLSPDQRKFLDLAKRNADRLSRLIDDLLDLSQIESGKVPMRRHNVNLIKTAQEVIDSFKLLAADKDVTLDLKSGSSSVKVWADSDKITQVISNLVDNAIKYSPKVSTVTVEVFTIGNIVEVGVVDNGIGISKEDTERLFDKFSRLEDAIHGEVKGTGLGLAIARELVHMHNGEIYVDSKPGEGSRFYFTLPKDLRNSRRKK